MKSFYSILRLYTFCLCLSICGLSLPGANFHYKYGISASFDIGPATNSHTNKNLAFNATGIGIASYLWDFGDGFVSTSNPSSHTYTSEGIYNVTLTVSDGIVSVSETKEVFITSGLLKRPEQAYWAFGYGVGLDFSSGNPVGVSPKLESLEACASICDTNANLLFYTDGINVWNRNHTIMPSNVGNLMNGSPNSRNKSDQYGSASQGTLIVPDPASTSQYYIFTVSDVPRIGNTNNGLCYTKVNLSLNGGMGDIILSTLNTPAPLIPGKGLIKTTEHLTAIPDCNNGYWVIVHGNGNDPYFKDKLLAYHITPGGIAAPVESNSFSVNASTTWPSQYGYGHADVSPDGKLMAIVPGRVFEQPGKDANGTYIYKFDNSSGKFELLKALPEGQYGVSFSPESKFLYILDDRIDNGNRIRSGLLYQYEVGSLYSPSPVKYSFNSNHTEFVSMQAGPDGKIYLPRRTTNRLSVINFPEVQASATNPNGCGYNFDGPFLTSSTCMATLPNMIDAMTGANQPLIVSDSQQVCLGGTVTLSATGATSYTWTPAIGLNTTTGSQVIASPTASTTYTVTGYSGSCNYISYVSVNIINAISVNVSPASTALCSSASTLLTASGANSYSWYPSNGLSSTTGATVTASPSASTTYSVIGSSGSSCSDTAVANITINPAPFLDMCDDVSVCLGDSVFLCFETAAQVTYTWTPATGLSDPYTSNPSASPSSTTTYYLSITDNNGCTNSGSVKVTVNPLPAKPTVNVNGSILTSSLAQGYQWFYNGAPITGATLQTYTSIQNGLYSVKITDQNGCSNTSDWVNITVQGIKETEKERLWLSCYPNPFYENIEIFYRTESASEVHIEVKDMLGRDIISPVAERKNAGEHRFSLHSGQFEKAGIYSLLIKTDHKQVTTRIIHIR